MSTPKRSGILKKGNLKSRNLFITDEENLNNSSPIENTTGDGNFTQSSNVLEHNDKLNTNNDDINQPKRKVLLPNIRHLKYLVRSQQILDEIHKNMPVNGSLFITDTKDKTKALTARSYRKSKYLKPINNSKKNVNDFEYLDYNVFNNEDNSIKNLMNKFKIKNKQKKLPRLERKKLVLNQLYGITPELNEKIAKLKNEKNLCLEDYQSKIMTTLGSYGSIGSSELMDLLQNLKELKMDSESVQPLPPINIDVIYDHVLNNKSKPKNIRSKSIKEILNEKEEPKDEFEKEEMMIKKIQRGSLKKVKIKRNGHLDVLPPYLKNLLKYT